MKIAALTAILCVIIPLQASAYCDPSIDRSVKGEYLASTYVVSAIALKETWLNEKGRPIKLHGKLMFGNMPGGFDPYLGANYDLRILKSYKGKAPRHLVVFSENSTARTNLMLNVNLLLFLQPQLKEDRIGDAGPYIVDSCGNSLRFKDAAAKIIEKLN